MERNKLIYGLADAALVVSSAAENGGTWAGATEALKHGRVPVYVRSTGAIPAGNQRLLEAGARKFPQEPWSNLRSVFEDQTVPAGLFVAQGANESPSTPALEETNLTPPPGTDEPRQPAPSLETAAATVAAPLRVDIYDVYVHALPVMLDLLREPRNERSFAEALHVVPSQAKAWLKRAVADGRVRKVGKPVQYVAVSDCMPLFPEKSKA